MASVPIPSSVKLRLVEWLPLVIGYLALYVPSFVALSETIWTTEEQAHGPIILLVVAWLLWQRRSDILGAEGRPAACAGWTSLILGLLLYVVGRSQDIILLDMGSQIPVLAGALLITRGWGAIKQSWFPLLFLVFMVPLPGPLVDAATGPLKRHVSVFAESILYSVGYPIGRSGVVLTIGQYQLLVADACSGLNSMFSLSALGLLYLYMMGYKNPLRIGSLIASILPIAFVANVIRVMVLVLITYHFGDEAGQGFAHGFAGMVLFVVALMLLFAIDAVLGRVMPEKRSS